MKKLNPNNMATEAARLKLDAAIPGTSAFDRLFGTPGEKYPTAPNYPVEGVLEQMALNQNELIDKVAALEARPVVPFPAAS